MRDATYVQAPVMTDAYPLSLLQGKCRSSEKQGRANVLPAVF